MYLNLKLVVAKIILSFRKIRNFSTKYESIGDTNGDYKPILFIGGTRKAGDIFTSNLTSLDLDPEFVPVAPQPSIRGEKIVTLHLVAPVSTVP